MEPGAPQSIVHQHVLDAVDADLGLLLAELNRVRSECEAGDEDAVPSVDEALTLASTAIRLVETHLGLQPDAPVTAEDVALPRDVLRATLAVLRAASTVAGEPALAGSAIRGRHWRRRGH